jgi:hypothetical protein
MGSLNELGNWNSTSSNNQGLDLIWNNGNIWKGQIPFKENLNFEYKFIFQKDNNGSNKKWENGGNRIFNYKDIIQKLNKNELDKEGKINFTIDNNDRNIYQYDQKEEKLIIKCIWKN